MPKLSKIAAWLALVAVSACLVIGFLYWTNRPIVLNAEKFAYHGLKKTIQTIGVTPKPVYRADSPIVVYDGNLGKGWQDWSWAKRSLTETTVVYSGNQAISMVPTEQRGVYFHHDSLSTAGFGVLQFYVNNPGNIKVSTVDPGLKFNTPAILKRYLIGTPMRGWYLARIPLADLGAPESGGEITGVVFQSATASGQLTMYLDDITLQPDLSLPLPPTLITIPVSVNPNADQHPISPYIYGLSLAPGDHLSDLNVKLNRWGGDDKSRYNWAQGNAENSARDYFFINRPADDGISTNAPSSAADAFVTNDIDNRCGSLITIPTLGWVAADEDNGHKSVGVPSQGGPPLTNVDGAIAGYDPTVNRNATSVRSLPKKPGPFADLPSATGPVYQDEWVHHLVDTFGDAGHKGVEFYAMDNESDLWDIMHTDVHPARMGYDDLLSNFLTYATAVKDVDPTAQVTGPVSSGWTAFYYSALDRGSDNFKTHADRTKHGDVPFLPWFLKQVHDHDVKTGKRTLDVLDVHFYPQAQGVYGPNADDRDLAALRLRSTRCLWDPNYVDESWIAQPVDLIPRLQGWIADNYPGTKLGITEWNWGADQAMNGGLAIADVLGIYGREGVYLANYWAFPTEGTPGYLAFKMYRNADGAGHGFGDISIHAVSSDPDSLSVFAARDSATGYLTLMFINKLPRTSITAPITMASGLMNDRIIDEFQLSATAPSGIVHTDTLRGVIPNAVTLPPYSITLVRIATGDTSQ